MSAPAAAAPQRAILLGSLRFALRVGRGFLRNDGFVLASAIAYDGLLSVVPLLLCATAVFTRFVDPDSFLRVVRSEILAVVPSQQAQPVIDSLTEMLVEPQTGGVLGLLTLLFFSTHAIRTLQHGIDVIFSHRHEQYSPRSLVRTVLIALAYVLAFGVVSAVQALSLVRLDQVPFIAAHLPRFSDTLSTLGFAALFTSFYLFMPVGRGNLRAALIGGALAAVLWRVVQSGLVYYLEQISRVNVIYGSLSAVIVVLLSFEIAAMIALICAQVVAELEQAWAQGRSFYELGEDPKPAPHG